MLRTPHLVLASLTALLCCATASSQSVTYLNPGQWRANQGDLVTVSPALLSRSWGVLAQPPAARAAASNGMRHRDASWYERTTDVLFVRGAGTQTNHDAPPEAAPVEVEREGSAPAGAPVRRLRFRAEGADTWMVGADWAPRTEWTSREHLNSFLKFHGEAWPVELPADQRRVSVAQYESSKVLAVVPDATGRSGSSGTAMSKTAQRAQLRPLNDPCMTSPGNSLLLRLYLPEGVPLERQGTVTQLDSGETVPFPFDAEGYGAVTIPSAGPWLVEVHAAAEPTESTLGDVRVTHRPDVVVHTVTLGFEAPPAPPKEKAVPSKEVR